MQHYAEIADDIEPEPLQEVYRPNFTKKANHEDHYERQKYTDELRKLQDQLSEMKEKGLMVEVLEKQIESKNECIDFLRNQLEIVETNSKQLLSVINNL